MSISQTWTKDSYKRAAIKHYHNCQYIFNQIPSIKDANYKNHVVSDCYYIGGYVMECALKYYVMSKNHIEQSLDKTGLINQRLWTHNLQHLIELASEGSETVEIEWKNLCKLTKEWSEEVRYDKSFKAEELSGVTNNFKADMENIYTKVFRQF